MILHGKLHQNLKFLQNYTNYDHFYKEVEIKIPFSDVNLYDTTMNGG
jgi:hypothetical protein